VSANIFRGNLVRSNALSAGVETIL
jgi:hypothetical protein